MFTAQRHGELLIVQEWHMCVSCFKMFCLNKEQYTLVVKNKKPYYVHTTCVGDDDAIKRLRSNKENPSD